MRSKILMTLEALLLLAVMLTFTACFESSPGYAPYGYGSAPSYEGDEWYQGQRGHWYQEGNRQQWKGAKGDQWYQGQRGHWYREDKRWQWRAE